MTATTFLASLTAIALQQQPDTAYVRLIREATTDPHFLPATVASIPDHAAVPSPLDHFGTIAGAPGIMHRSAELFAYYRALAAASPRVTVEVIGRTEEGREIVLVVVADEATLDRVDEIKQDLAALADPRVTDEAAMRRIVTRAKPVYYLKGGLHSPEMGPPEMLPELAYRLAVSDDPMIRRIRENVVTIINPVAEPDGRDKQVDWYYRYSKGREEWGDGFPRSSPYWGKYVYHDNNRDGLQISQALSKAVNDVYFAWHPTVMHDLHESVPLLYVSTGTGPYNRNVDPITLAEWQTFANWDVQKATEQGLPGVFTWAFYDGWWPGYSIWVAVNHNGIGRFYETFGNAGADTYLRDLRGQTYAGDSVTSAQWYRPWPATKKVYWSLRNNTNYMQAGVLASLDYTARHAQDLLENFWQKSKNSLERGRTQKPHAFVIAGLAEQRDPRRAAYLINQLMRHGIEVHRIASPEAADADAGERQSGRAGEIIDGENGRTAETAEAADTTRPAAGSFVVKLDQPYRDFAVSLLTPQDYPENAKYPPYDDVSWTLPLLYGVEVKAVDDTAAFSWTGLDRLQDTVAYIGTATAATAASAALVRYTAQQELAPALFALRERRRNARVFAAETSFAAADTTWPVGTVIVEGASAQDAEWLARTYGLEVVRAAVPDVRRHALDLPRIAIYHTWYSTQDEGWARYWFDQLRIPYTNIDKDDLEAGNLRRRFDVILVPNAGGSVTTWIHGVDRKWGPMPFTRTNEFTAHGTPDATDDMTGGPGFAGMAQLERFADEGGTIITIENAARLVAETGIVRTLSEYSGGSLFHPGSSVRVKARRPDHPIMYGYPDTTHVFRGNGVLWRTALRDRGTIVLQYGTKALADERDTVVTEILGSDAMPETHGGTEAPRQRADSASSASGAGQGGGGAASPASGEGSGGGTYVLSGMVRNSGNIVGHGAIFSLRAGKDDAGRVVVFTFNPLHRYLNQHDAGFVINAILNWNDLE
jgi:hypothetical protein